MNVSCGTDIIEISRIKDSIEKYDGKLKSTVYTEKEIEYCEKHGKQKYQHYAVRFAAKEAIFKAVSKRLSDTFNWTDFEILNSKSGKPEVKLKVNIPEIQSVDISLSHCKEYATAMVVVLFS